MIAADVGFWSKDPSTKVGAVFVSAERRILSTGYNGFPRGVDDDVEERWLRPEKYFWTAHAEVNAIYNAAFEGVSLRESTLYTPFLPCHGCAQAIVQVGCERVVLATKALDYPWDDPGGKSGLRAMEMLHEADVAIVENVLNEEG